jgi:hypothetical protein
MSAATDGFSVSKEYYEDLGTRDDQGRYEYAYKWFGYEFDFGDRQYWAKVYTDTPDEAAVGGVSGVGGRAIPRSDLQATRDLQAIARYFKEVEGIQLVKVGRSAGYEPLDELEGE